MKLAVVIPALNEEASIANTIERTLAASARIVAETPVTEVEVVVVSDGSTDDTVALASKYVPRIRLIVFERNRGYGAAIMEGWSHSTAELLGFLDADGTCDPLLFVDLVNTIEKTKADVVLGCRLHAASKMPPIRRVGNRLFGILLTMFAERRVRDTASGMRVVRRSSLPRLLPLPTGLHFTPAMSARALLDDHLKIVEIDMPYEEREGESKLRVVRDGLRFLKIILETTLLYRPGRPLALGGAFAFGIGAALMAQPILHYFSRVLVEDWMIYRFVVGNLFGIASCVLFCGAYLSRKIVNMTLGIPLEDRIEHRGMAALFHASWFWAAPASLVIAGGILVLPAFFDLLATGRTSLHWSRFIVMSFLYSVAFVLSVAWIMDRSLDLIRQRQEYFRSSSSDSSPT